jgi:hypothetical protein
MKRVLLLLVVLATGAFAYQAFDLAGSIDASTGIVKPVHAAAADSGIRVDRAGYQCAVWEITSGQADNAAGQTSVVVSLDSIPGTAAWQLKDSITMDTVDNKSYELAYKGTQRWVRLLARATSSAADTIAITGLLVQGCKRSRG